MTNKVSEGKSNKGYFWVKNMGLEDITMTEIPEILLNTPKTPSVISGNGSNVGSRNNDLTSYVGKFLGSGMNYEEVLEEALKFNKRNNPPLSEKEVKTIVNSIYSREMESRKQEIVTVGTEVTVADKEIFPTTPVPIEILPENLIVFINLLSSAFHVSPEVVACCIFSIISGAIGNTIRISPKQGWEVPIFIWLILIARTGYGKTPLIGVLMKETERLMSVAYKEYQEEMKEYNRLLRRAKEDPSTEIPDKPKLKHYMVSDFTIEASADVFEDDPRGTIIHIDELAGLILGLNQYKGKGNDRQHFLELFNAGSWKIDRRTGSRFIPNTGASIIGGIQPKVLSEVFGSDSIDEGFLPRFILIQSDSKPPKFSRQTIKGDDLDYWQNLINWCYQIQAEIDDSGFIKSETISLTDEALNEFEDFYNESMALLPFLSETAQAFIPKLITYCLKFAGVLHILKAFDKDIDYKRPIGKETVKDAIKLTKFFSGEAMKVLSLYNSSETTLNEYQKKIIQTLHKLQSEVRNGTLPLSKIVEAFNDGLPEAVIHSPEKITKLLQNFGLETKKSTGNLSVLIWEDAGIRNLFLKTTVPSVTTVTNQSDLKETYRYV